MASVRRLAPDLILHNGRIYTLDQRNATVQALAIKDGRVVAAGADIAVLQLAGEGTSRVDLERRAVIPGIFDSHNHMLEVGEKLSWLRLDECQSPADMAELVRERARATPPGGWIIGMGWNEGNFPGGRLPVLDDIDAAAPDHPVILMRFFNTDLVNSHALRLAGVTSGTPNPVGGRVEHDAAGRPNGLLRGTAKTLVRRLLPQSTPAELAEALRLGCLDLNRLGITSIVDPGLYPHEMQAYVEAWRRGALTVRTNIMPNWHGFQDDETEAQLDSRATELGLSTGLGDEWLRLGGLKMAVDGGTSPRTALMYEPYEGETEMTALLRLSPDDLRRYFGTAQRLGWDVGIHCCGDHAQDIAVEALAAAMTTHPRPDMRHNIIHAYFPSERALELMARHQIAAVIQPSFIYWEGTLIFRDVGERRARNYKPARRYLGAGVPLTASSDLPSTVTAEPFCGMYSLVTRRNAQGDLIAPDQGITRLEALRAYTSAGCWLTREEGHKGTLEPGKLADLVVLDRDYFAVPESQIREVKPVLTMVGGRVVWEARGAVLPT